MKAKHHALIVMEWLAKSDIYLTDKIRIGGFPIANNNPVNVRSELVEHLMSNKLRFNLSMTTVEWLTIGWKQLSSDG